VTGTIVGVEDHGTIVTVEIVNQAAAEVYRVHFDHRMFRHLVEGRGGIDHVVQQPVVVDRYGTFDEALTFLDDIAEGHQPHHEEDSDV
jgi:hypothetical protein